MIYVFYNYNIIVAVWALISSVQFGKYQPNNSNSYEKITKIHLHDFNAYIYITVVTLSAAIIALLVGEGKYIEQNLLDVPPCSYLQYIQ